VAVTGTAVLTFTMKAKIAGPFLQIILLELNWYKLCYIDGIAMCP
jgi:hypothetical protein